jgi:hypothetical protein
MSRLYSIPISGSELLSDIEQLRHYRLSLFEAIISYFKRHETLSWSAIRYIEFTPLFLLRRRKIAGTIFNPFAELLKLHAFQVDGTLGDVMDILGLDRQDVHHLACHCLGKKISGSDAARRLDYYAQFHLRTF